ncbi:MAG: serine/threonine-protein phosphatase [Oscillospiraceae bacterium]|nr:serine/threonine-protein phosphatase [Oscillospiraceae bacterium]
MNGKKKLYQRIREQKWLLPAGLACLCVMTCASIFLCFGRGLVHLEPPWIFNVAADIVGIIICTVLFFGCISGERETHETTYLFVALLSTNAAALFLDECAWLVQGVPPLRAWNLIVNVLFYAAGVDMTYQFWRYARAALDMDDKLMRYGATAVRVLAIPAALACFANLFVPVYFSVDEFGVYHRGPAFPFSYAYFAISIFILLFGLLRSNAPQRQKTVVLSFVAMPMLNAALTWNKFGISTQYIAALTSIVLIYSILFSDRSKLLAAKKTELNLATNIQAGMLPRTFPPFPDRTEFDVYASMDPAREVGGDFYDIFLVDDDHLCLVIADVSGKGVPAALFMMASKIILADKAMAGMSPAQILAETNDRICTKNKAEMFVTVWLGILEISTGKLTAANAGHEYPAIRRADGGFELLKDKHGFVIGGMEGARYREYELMLEPGAKLFVYTDGVPEATDASNGMFGTDRMLEALNEEPDAAPERILKNVRRAVDDFVKDAEQFDDMTMLCIEYRG